MLQHNWGQNRDLMKRGHATGFPQHLGTEDFAMFISQGTVHDRSQEQLCSADGAVLRVRSLLLKAAREFQAGKTPTLAAHPELDYTQGGVGRRCAAGGQRLARAGRDGLMQRTSLIARHSMKHEPPAAAGRRLCKPCRAYRTAACAADGKPVIRILVGLPPGGGTDAIARVIADRLPIELGQPVIVENKVGVGGRLAADALMAAAPMA